MRDSKRQTYMKFLDWCEENQSLMTHYQFTEDHKVNTIVELRNQDEILDMRMTILDLHNIIHETVSKRFNGNIVSDITKLEGKELGMFMAFMKSTLSDPSNKKYTSIDNMVLNNSDEEIRHIINALYLSFKYTIPSGIEL